MASIQLYLYMSDWLFGITACQCIVLILYFGPMLMSIGLILRCASQNDIVFRQVKQVAVAQADSPPNRTHHDLEQFDQTQSQ